MNPIVRRCSTVGCEAEAEVKVIVNDVDGEWEWSSCWEHAREFQDWAQSRVHEQGGWLLRTFRPKKDPWGPE